jgi:hypothetical protein
MSDSLDDWRALNESRAKAARQTWAVANIGATITPDIEWCPSVQGPTVIPYHPWGGGDPTGRFPNHPGLYGRYLVIDLTENNRASIDAFCERFPDRPRPDYGFGVCRHGFGLQSFGDGYMTEEVAEARAIALNAGRPATDVPNIDREEAPCA